MVTGLGVLSSLGFSLEEVVSALQYGCSGLVFMPEMQELGFKCNIYGPVKSWNSENLDKRAKQTMSTVALYALGTAKKAINDAGFELSQLQNERTCVFVGTSFGGINELFKIEHCVKKLKKPTRAGLTGIVKVMNSTASANLATYFGIKGRTGSISSSFASGIDNIGHGYELIKFGLQDVCISGSSEGDCWKQLGVYFDNWKGMPMSFNNQPAKACRPYDRDRQGFVMSCGAGILILEALDHARKRGAKIYAEIVGFGSANDGDDMFRPNGKGLKRAICQALTSNSNFSINFVDYINTHGTGTSLGDRVEVKTIKDVFGSVAPLISSTKGLTGHGLGAAGAQEAVYTLLMLRDDFVVPTTNLENIAPDCNGVPHVQIVEEKSLSTAMSFNVGLGGTASCIVFKKI